VVALPWRRNPTPLEEADMTILAWIVLGLVAGAIAKALMPGRDPGGIIVTMLIGIVGAFLGGFLGNMITGAGLNGFSLWSIVLAVVGAMLLLWIYRMTTRTRTTV
jgi:uncharacterized membrane protein YeaQ/YmgE (transglycosylase-associated protein family)